MRLSTGDKLDPCEILSAVGASVMGEGHKAGQAFESERGGQSQSGPTAHELFEARAAAQPDSIALVYREQHVTCGELNRLANRLAHLLIRHGIGPERFAGICLDPSIEAIVAILAILKAGGAYIALEPSDPPATVSYTHLTLPTIYSV